ncbi:hypothetical protein OIU77_030734, partial [Salix suchowensis]
MLVGGREKLQNKIKSITNTTQTQLDCSSFLSVSNLLYNLLNRVAFSVKGGDGGVGGCLC